MKPFISLFSTWKKQYPMNSLGRFLEFFQRDPLWKLKIKVAWMSSNFMWFPYRLNLTFAENFSCLYHEEPKHICQDPAKQGQGGLVLFENKKWTLFSKRFRWLLTSFVIGTNFDPPLKKFHNRTAAKEKQYWNNQKYTK